MARLPDSTALGQRPSPEAPRPVFGIANAGLSQAASAEGMKDVAQFADQLAQAGDRIMTRQETVDRARAYGEYDNAAANELRRLSTEGDFSKLETTQQYGEFLSKKRDEILNAHVGRGDSRAALASRLELSRARFADHAAAEGVKAGEQVVLNALGKSINGLVDKAYRGRESLSDLFAGVDQAVNEMAPAMMHRKDLDILRVAKEQVGLARFNQILDAGGWGEAEKLRDGTVMYGKIFGAASQHHINQRIAAQKQKMIEEETKAQRKLYNDIYVAQGKAQALGGTPEQRQENFAIALGIEPKSKGELFDLMGKIEKLEKAGQNNTPEYKIYVQRLSRMTQDAGMQINFDSNSGILSLQQGAPGKTPITGPIFGGGSAGGGAGLFPPGNAPAGQPGGVASGLTPIQALPQAERFDNLSNAITTVDAAMKAIQDDPSRAGAMGSVRRAVQTGVGIGSDIVPLIESISGLKLKNLGQSTAQSIRNDPSIPQDVKNILLPEFDRSLSDLDVWENSMAVELAKLRMSAGGQGSRALVSIYKEAKKDVSMTGLKSSEQVLTKLDTVKKEFEKEKETLRKRLGGPSAASSELPPEAAQINDLDKRLKEIFGRGR